MSLSGRRLALLVDEDVMRTMEPLLNRSGVGLARQPCGLVIAPGMAQIDHGHIAGDLPFTWFVLFGCFMGKTRHTIQSHSVRNAPYPL